MSGAVDKDVVAGWQQVTQMNMKARLNKNPSPDNPPKSTYDSISNLPTVGYNTANVSTDKPKTKSANDIIVLSDEEETDGPSSHRKQTLNNGATPQVKPPIDTIDTSSIREKLLEEERKLNMLKALKNYQSPESSVTSNGRIHVTGFSKTHSIATVPPPIQGSALNKTSAKSSTIRMSTFEHHPLGQRPNQSKHSIVVVPGNLKPSQRSNTSTSVTASNAGTGISSRLQQLVDNVAVDQALPSDKKLSRLASNMQLGKMLKSASNTPPVPGLTSISSYKTGTVVTNAGVRSTSSPSVKPSHEMITISGLNSRAQPPPLLSTHSTLSTEVSMVTKGGSVQVPTISSTTGAKNLAILAMNKEVLTEKDQEHVKQVVENSKRYRDYMLKQTHTRRSFTKQLERKIVSSPYPKTFRQVWPIIPVHDSSFIANFGLEGVVNHFQSTVKPQTVKQPSKMKPVCNQCSCDFASAWQIRKGNSKQLLLCESCDFQNLKILQRSKLSSQLKELLETVKKEEEKFNAECEESRKKVIELEKQTLMAVSNKPPPLTSQLPSQPKGVVLGASTMTSNVIKMATKVPTQPAPGVVADVNPVASKPGTNGGSSEQHPVIPSILGQRIQQPELLAIDGIIKTTRKRKESPATNSTPPPSKSFKPGSTLDLTLTKLSQTLIKRKLDEQRQETHPTVSEDSTTDEQVPMEVNETSNSAHVSTPVAVETKLINLPDSRKKRRKGTPKHKRLISASSVTSE